MLPNPVSVGLLAFILFIVIDEHCLQAGGAFRKHGKREEATSSHTEAQTDSDKESGSGHSGRHSSVHGEHAGPSDPESVRFWKNLEDPDTTGHHFEESLVIVEEDEDDGYVYCLGSLVQLQDGDIKLLVPLQCAESFCSDSFAKVRLIYRRNNALIPVDRSFPLMRFRIPVDIAVMNVFGRVPRLPVRLAKPNMPMDGTVSGVSVHLDGSLMAFGVVDDRDCAILGGSITDVLFCFCARNDENSEARRGSPFFVKSSGEWYLAGIQESYAEKNKPGYNNILGGNVYTIVNDGVDIEPH